MQFNNMFANYKSGYPDHENDVSDGEFLRDIEEISKALYFDNNTHVNSALSFSNFGPTLPKMSRFVDFRRKSKHGFCKDNDGSKEEPKNSSIWGWKPFKALSHIRQKKFNCYFFCHVHCIENLMVDFNDASMVVVWKRKDGVLRTVPARVSNGVVEFEETLMSRCSVYGARNGAGDFVKYEPKHFLLYGFVVGAEGVDVGKHWVDLTRLLPVTFDELEQDKCSGKWSTSFKLMGKAKGATLHVSFGFLVTKDGLVDSGSNVELPLIESGLNRMSSADCSSVRGNTSLTRVGSVPSSLTDGSCYLAQCVDAKNGVLKESYNFSNSVTMLYGKLEEGRVDSPMKIDRVIEHSESLHLGPHSLSGSERDDSGDKHDDAEFRVVEKGIESNCSLEEEKTLSDSISVNLEDSCIEVIDIAEIFKDEDICSDKDIQIDRLDDAFSCGAKDAPVDKYSVAEAREPNIEEDLDLCNMLSQQSDELPMSELSVEVKVKHKGSNLVKSLSLDDIAKSVADDFCNMLEDMQTPSPRSSNADLESPRGRLLRQFEEDLITSGCLFLDVDIQDDIPGYEYEAPSVSSSDHISERIDLPPIIDIAGIASKESIHESLRNKLKAESLERLETRTLMQRWGLNEEDFLNSPYYSNGGFGSPISISPEEPVGLPPLAEGIEPLLHLKGGGFLRSMSPLLFRNTKNCGPLIIQTSKTLVLPVELGSDFLDIFQLLASIGSHRLSQKMYNLLPLEDLSGKIMQQLAWEASSIAGVLERPASSLQESDIMIEVVEHPCFQGYNYLSSSTAGSDIGSVYLSPKDIALLALDSIEALAIEGLKIQSGMPDHDAPSSIRVEFACEVGSSEHISECFDDSSDILGVRGSAEYINGLLDFSISMDEWLRLDSGLFGDNKEVTKTTLKVLRAHHANLVARDKTQKGLSNCCVFGDKLTLALMMQLRDPLRNYEPVGGPMLSLIQIRRLTKPLAHILEDDKVGEDLIPRFRLEEVHVGGLNLESDNLEMWSSKRQQQAGTRWLLASGLTKSTKPHFSKSRSIMKMSTQVLRRPWTRSFIWSISRPIHGVAADPLTRNPDVMFPQVSV